jgi:hypothetical protein
LAGGEPGHFDEAKAMRFLEGLREIIRNDLSPGKAFPVNIELIQRVSPREANSASGAGEPAFLG